MIGDIKIYGTVQAVLPLQSGVSKSGNEWKKQEYILETIEQYPRKVKFDLFGDKVDQYPLQEGNVVTLYVNIESREFNGRWYTDVRAWKVENGDTRAEGTVAQTPALEYVNPVVAGTSEASPSFVEPVIPQFPGAAAAPNPTDDLPF